MQQLLESRLSEAFPAEAFIWISIYGGHFRTVFWGIVTKHPITG